jgi:hypothetical protein
MSQYLRTHTPTLSSVVSLLVLINNTLPPVYVCMCVYMYVYVCIYVCVCMYVYVYVCISVFIGV